MTVFFNGSFDLINAGHVRAIKNSQNLGDKLILGVNSDELMAWFKREPIMPWDQRAEILRAMLRPNDLLIKTHEPAAINYLKMYACEVYILTEEWESAQKPAIDYIKSIGGKVIFSPRWEDIMDCTTIRQRVYDTVRRESGGSV